jgi:OstA-like protein
MICKHTSVLKSAIFFILYFSVYVTNAQTQRPTYGPTATAPSEEKVNLIYADSIVFVRQPDGTELRRVQGHVSFKHKGALMYCNLAILNAATNVLEAFGKVKIIQNDTITITGDTLYYYGNSRFAKVSGKSVVLNDRKRTLTTTRLEYDMVSGIAYYPERGKTVDAENTLTSKQGYYDTRTKLFTYYQDVKLVNKKYTLTTDTLFYNSLTKLADFRSLTKVVSKDGTLLARNGTYNTETGASVFRTRTTIDNPDYTLTGDSLTFDNLNKRGFAKGNVELVGKNDRTILNGDHGVYDGKAGQSKVWGHALTRNISQGDTMYMTADTLYSIEIKADPLAQDSASLVLASKLAAIQKDSTNENKPRKLIGNKNVFIYRKDFQSKCDSLIYNTLDSTITFLKKPTLWATKYQMEADSIVAQLANQKLKTMHLRVKSFVIAQDTLFNFNQVKGRSITAYFDDSTRLERVFVEGNGESIYYALNEKNKGMGMNRVEASKMTLNFRKNQVKRILFTGQPDGKFMPPKDLKVEDKELDGFNWRTKEKPTREQLLASANIKLSPRITVEADDKEKAQLRKPNPKTVEKPKVKSKKNKF